MAVSLPAAVWSALQSAGKCPEALQQKQWVHSCFLGPCVKLSEGRYHFEGNDDKVADWCDTGCVAMSVRAAMSRLLRSCE